MTAPSARYTSLIKIYLRPEWRKVGLLTVLVLGTIGLQLLNPQIIRYFIDTATTQGSLQKLVAAAMLFLGVALTQQVIGVAAVYVGEDVGWTATNRMRADLMLHCLKLDMYFHNERTPGQMIERIDGDVANLAIFFAQFVVRVFRACCCWSACCWW